MVAKWRECNWYRSKKETAYHSTYKCCETSDVCGMPYGELSAWRSQIEVHRQALVERRTSVLQCIDIGLVNITRSKHLNELTHVVLISQCVKARTQRRNHYNVTLVVWCGHGVVEQLHCFFIREGGNVVVYFIVGTQRLNVGVARWLRWCSDSSSLRYSVLWLVQRLHNGHR